MILRFHKEDISYMKENLSLVLEFEYIYSISGHFREEKRKRKEVKVTFETTRGISTQPSSSLSSHSEEKGKVSMQKVSGCGVRTCKDGSDIF